MDSGSHEVISAQISIESVGDNQELPALLNPLRRQIDQVSADGAYDTKASHQLLLNKGCKAMIPPRETDALWPQDHPRNVPVKALKAGQLVQ